MDSVPTCFCVCWRGIQLLCAGPFESCQHPVKISPHVRLFSVTSIPSAVGACSCRAPTPPGVTSVAVSGSVLVGKFISGIADETTLLSDRSVFNRLLCVLALGIPLLCAGPFGTCH